MNDRKITTVKPSLAGGHASSRRHQIKLGSGINSEVIWSGHKVVDPSGNPFAYATQQEDANRLADAFTCGLRWAENNRPDPHGSSIAEAFAGCIRDRMMNDGEITGDETEPDWNALAAYCEEHTDWRFVGPILDELQDGFEAQNQHISSTRPDPDTPQAA